MGDKERVFSILNGMEESMIQALKEQVRIPSVASEGTKDCPYGKEVDRALKSCLSLARSLGLLAREVDGQMGVVDLSEEKPYVGFLCHLDVVPAGDGWSLPPYEGVIRDGKMYGRGTTDNKGAAISVLFAMAAIRQAGIRLKKGVRFLAGTNEERGSSDLKYYRLVEELPPVVITPDGMYPLINVEKGRIKGVFSIPCKEHGRSILSIRGAQAVNIVPAAAKARLSGITVEVIQQAISLYAGLETEEGGTQAGYEYQVEEISGDGPVTEITVWGKGAHAATPEQGKNALCRLYSLLSKLPLKEEKQILARLSKTFPCGEYHGESCGVFCEDEVSGKITLVHSMAFRESDRIRGELDIRFPVTYKAAEIERRLKEGLEREGICLEKTEKSEGHYTDSECGYVKTLLRIFKEHTGISAEPVSMGGGTYVHEVEGGVAFGILMPGEEPVPTHGADEYILLRHLLLNARMFAQAMLELCGE